jgi:hypothetical protein
MVAAHPASRPAIGPGALWFGLFGAPVAWSVQELTSYALIAHACYPSWHPRSSPVTSSPWITALMVSLSMLLVGLAGGLTAYRAWRLSRHEHASPEAHQLEVGEDRVRFMAISGLIVSSILLFNLLMNTVTLFFVPAC